MTSQDSAQLAHRAELIYQQRLKQSLEHSNPDDFVAIEPLSGDYFLGRTLSEAVGVARKAHPNRLSYALRVAHQTAVHLGNYLR